VQADFYLNASSQKSKIPIDGHAEARERAQCAEIVSKCKTLNNGTVRFKNVNNYLNTNFYSILDTSGGQSSNLYLNVVHFFSTSVNLASAAA
jgi:hypothetical protein